jgi:hypothetical protein
MSGGYHQLAQILRVPGTSVKGSAVKSWKSSLCPLRNFHHYIPARDGKHCPKSGAKSQGQPLKGDFRLSGTTDCPDKTGPFVFFGSPLKKAVDGKAPGLGRGERLLPLLPGTCLPAGIG